MIRKLCEIENDEHLGRIIKSTEPLLRNKTRAILIMGINYEEVSKETEQVIINFMTLRTVLLLKAYGRP